jgi:hypothetical protein
MRLITIRVSEGEGRNVAELAFSKGIKEWQFLRQAALALLVSTVLIFLAGICVALVSAGPVLFEIKGTVLSGAVLVAIIGFAAGLGSIDDAGRRELIGPIFYIFF